MDRLSRLVVVPLLVSAIGFLAISGCSQPATPPPAEPAAPKVEANKPEPAVTPESSPPAEPEPTVEPDNGTPESSADNAVAALIEKLTTTDDSRTRVITIDAIATRQRGGLPALDALVKSLADEEPRVRWHAARALGLIGRKAAPAIPDLVIMLEDEDAVAVTQAAAAIGHIRGDDSGSEIPDADAETYAAAIDPLVATLVHPDPRVRRAAVRALRVLSTSPEELARAVRRQLADADPVAVLPAMHTLADLEEDAVPFLVEALGDPKSRYWAEVVLAEIGEEAAAAVVPLAKVATDGEIEERVQAILALARIGEPATVAAPQIMAALESPDASLHYVAAYALGQLRIASADEALEKAAASDDPFLATLASWARARIHPDDAALRAQAVERLETGLTADSPAVRRAAVEGLSGLADALTEADRKELAVTLTGMITDPVPGVGLAAGGALIRLGEDAVDALGEALSVAGLRSDAMEILAELGPAARPALDEMVSGLADTDPLYRADSAMAIAAIGPQAKGAVSALEKLLGDESAESAARYTAAYALGRIGPDAVAAEPLLRKLAEADNELMATVAIWAVLKIKPDDAALFETAVPKLRHALKHEQDLVRLEAAVALGEIGPRAETALPMLELLAEEDPSPNVRAAATAATRQIRTPE